MEMLLPGWLSTVVIAVYEDVDDLILMKISRNLVTQA